MFFFLAWRNLERNVSRTILLLVSIALVTALVAIMQAQLAGLQQDIYRQVVKNIAGDAQILAYDRAGKATNFAFDESQQKQFAILFPSCSYNLTLQGHAWLQQNEDVINIRLLGMNTFGNEPIKGLVLSPTLLALLHLQVGDSIALSTLPTAPKELFKIIEKRHLPFAQADNIAILPLAIAQKFIKTPSQVSTIAVQYTEKMPPALPAWVRRQGLVLQTWQEALPDIAQMLMLLKATFILVWSILYGLLGISVGLVFIQNWRERTPEIQRLRILGLLGRQVWLMLAVELNIITALGYVLGLLCALPIIFYSVSNPIALPADIIQALQSIGFPAQIRFGWDIQIILVPLIGIGVLSAGLSVAAVFMRK